MVVSQEELLGYLLVGSVGVKTAYEGLVNRTEHGFSKDRAAEGEEQKKR